MTPHACVAETSIMRKIKMNQVWRWYDCVHLQRRKAISEYKVLFHHFRPSPLGGNSLSPLQHRWMKFFHEEDMFIMSSIILNLPPAQEVGPAHMRAAHIRKAGSGHPQPWPPPAKTCTIVAVHEQDITGSWPPYIPHPLYYTSSYSLFCWKEIFNWRLFENVLNLQLCLRYVVKIIKNILRALHRNLHMYRRYYFPLTGGSLAPKHCNAKFELMIWSFIQHGCIIELVKKLRFKIWSIVLDKQWHLMVCVHA